MIASENARLLQIAYTKHCGVWLNATLSLNPFSVFHIVLSHADQMSRDEIAAVETSLRSQVDDQLTKQIEFFSAKGGQQALSSHLSQLKDSFEFIHSACFKPGIDVENKLHQQFFQWSE